MANVNIQRVGGRMFNILVVEEWLVGLFHTNNDVWRFLTYLGEQLEAGEPVPESIYIFTIALTGVPEDPVKILETATVVKQDGHFQDEVKPYFIYKSLHERADIQPVQESIMKYWPEIEEALNA